MVKHSQLFIDSLVHPKKLAGYRMLIHWKSHSICIYINYSSDNFFIYSIRNWCVK